MSSDDPHGHDKEPMILTSPRRFGKGLVIVVAIMAVGAGITIPLFDQMFEIPPPVTQIRTESPATEEGEGEGGAAPDRKSTRLNSSHANISYAVFCLKKKKKYNIPKV